MSNTPDPELLRLLQDEQRQQRWKLWGTYLAERQWGTIREDYAASGDPWTYFPHDHARSRAYRWGEDGLFGLTETLPAAFCAGSVEWRRRDTEGALIRLDGARGQSRRGREELYYYQDATPTHGYCRALYKYPQRAFPYQDLVYENARRGR